MGFTPQTDAHGLALHSAGANGGSHTRAVSPTGNELSTGFVAAKHRVPWGAILKWMACAVAVGFLVRALVQADLPRAAALIVAAGPWVVIIAAPFLGAILFDSLACRVLFGVLGRRTKLGQIVGVRLTSEAVNMSLPAGGVLAESLNPYLFNRRCGVPGSEAVAGMAGKKWLQMRGHGLYILVSVVVGFAFLREHSRAIIGFDGLPFLVLASAFVPLGLSIAMAATLSRGAVVERLHALLGKLPSQRLRGWLDGRRHQFVATDALFARFATMGREREIGASALFVAAWLMESVETFVILRVLGAPVSYAEVLSFEAGLSLLRNLAFFAPGGLGVLDLGYMAYLGALGYPGASTIGAAFVLLKRAKELFWIAIGYALLLLLRGKPAIVSSEPAEPAAASAQAAP